MLRLVLYDDETKVYSEDFAGEMVIGRSGENEPPPYTRLKLDESTRVKEGLKENALKLVFASSMEAVWSRSQVILVPLKDSSNILVKNGGTQRRFRIEKGPEIGPNGSCEVPLPVVIDLGRKVIRVEKASAPGFRPDAGIHSLPNATIPPLVRKHHPHMPTLAGLPPSTNRKELIAWLHAATDVLQAAANSDEFFESAAAAAVQMADLDVVRYLEYREGNWYPQAVKQARPSSSELQRPSRRVLAKVLEQKRTFWEVLKGDESQTSLRDVGAVVAAPVLDRLGRVIGSLYGERRAGLSAIAHPITEVEAMLIELLARGVAAGLARKDVERVQVALQQELEIGRQIQTSFLPVSLPQPAPWEIGAKFEPAKEVSGDFYDVFPVSATHLGLVIADVCNKGVGAALFMALFRTLIRAFSQQGVARELTGWLGSQQSAAGSPGDRNLSTLLIEMNALTTVTLTNNYVANQHGETCYFATLFLGILDTATGTVHYINAGHESPIHIGPSGIKGRLKPTGAAVGIMPDQDYTLQTVTLEPGDLLFCYTDGVTDARSPKTELFTEKRLLELVNQPATSAAKILDLVEGAVKNHSSGGSSYDDITMLAVYRVPAPINK